jgi:integrase
VPVRSFILRKRYPGSSNPTRRTLGTYGEITLEEARAKGREWLNLIEKGIDPAAEVERLRMAALEAERRRTAATFGAALEAYLARKASHLRTGRVIANEMKRELGQWMDRPLAEISPTEVKYIIRQIADRGTPTQAHVIYGMVRAFFNWCIDTTDYGIEISPCARIKPAVLIGERNIRDRILQNHELAAYWRASEALAYPFGPFFKALVLTALRRNEAAGARWDEFDFEAKLWVVPASRMKAKETKAKPHAVPLTDDILALLESLPRYSGGDCIFSTTGGKRPISGFSKAKARLDALMRADLEARGKQFEDFVIHDVRRTVRTRLSALPIEQVVRELLLAHSQPGLHKVYDLHLYETEKRHALELWHAKLRGIVEARADNVLPFAVSA